MQSPPRRRRIRVVMMGDIYVGKTSLFDRFFNDTFSASPSRTNGQDEMQKEVALLDGEHTVLLCVTDTAGQESIRANFTYSYFRDKHGFMLVFDVTRRDTFDSLEKWLRLIKDKVDMDDEPCFLLVANKCDLLDDREVELSDAQAFADANGMPFVQCSAKESSGVTEAYIAIATNCFQSSFEEDTLDTDTGIVYLGGSGGGGGTGRRGTGSGGRTCPMCS